MKCSFFGLRRCFGLLSCLACAVLSSGSAFASFVISAPVPSGPVNNPSSWNSEIGKNFANAGNSAVLVLHGFHAPNPSQANVDAALAAYFAPNTTPTEQYKIDHPSTESGAAAGFYSTVFSNSSSDPSDATIKWNGPQSINNAGYVLVKDGNHQPKWFLFNVQMSSFGAGWNGQHDLKVTGFWPNGGAISHVTLYGGALQTPPAASSVIPEPASSALMLLGLATFSSGIFRFRR